MSNIPSSTGCVQSMVNFNVTFFFLATLVDFGFLVALPVVALAAGLAAGLAGAAGACAVSVFYVFVD
jgi:hypothetical protein